MIHTGRASFPIVPAAAMRAAMLVASLATGACIRPPPIIIADRHTVLEQQASVPFDQLQQDLQQAGVSPGPVPLTRGQVEAAGGDAGALPLQPQGPEPDDVQLDRLLVRRCLGEALDGTLVQTPQTCPTPLDAQRVGSLLERTNRNRWQIWHFLQEQRPGTSLEEARKAWRQVHLEGLVCGAQVQGPDGRWGVRECAR